jgi:hypothetical protein
MHIGAEKQQWSKLIGLIEQKFMAKGIGYLDDEEEVASIKIPPPSPIFLEPPLHAEDPRDRDIRLRQQLLIDEERKLAATTAKDYKERFASDYPKAIAIIYSLVSETIRKDLFRAVKNAVPPIDQVLQDPRKTPGQVGTKFPESLPISREETPADGTSTSSPTMT